MTAITAALRRRRELRALARTMPPASVHKVAQRRPFSTEQLAREHEDDTPLMRYTRMTATQVPPTSGSGRRRVKARRNKAAVLLAQLEREVRA